MRNHTTLNVKWDSKWLLLPDPLHSYYYNQYEQIFDMDTMQLLPRYKSRIIIDRFRGLQIMTQTREEYELELALELESLIISQARNPSEYKEERIKRLQARLNHTGED